MILRKRKTAQKNKKQQAGFSLLEVLLVVGVSSVILVGSVQIVNDWAQQIADQEEAKYLLTVLDAADYYVNSNFADIWTVAMGESFTDSNGDGFCCDANDTQNFGRVIRIGMDAPAAGQPYFLMDAAGTLPLGFPTASPLNFEPRIFVRNIGYVGNERTFEIFVITDSISGSMLPVTRANNVANNIGPQGGAVSRINPGGVIFTGGFCGAGNIIGSGFGTWQMTMADLNQPLAINTDNSFCPATQPAPADAQGAYVAARRVLAFKDEINEEILYRVAIPGRPEANRMQANLDMNGLAITNVNAMNADKLQVAGNLTVGRTATTYIEETARFGGGGNQIYSEPFSATDPGCAWTVDGFGNRVVDPTATGLCDMKGGNLAITTGNAASGQDSFVATGLTAGAASLSAAAIEVGNNLDIGGRGLISGTATVGTANTGGVAATSMNVTGSLATSTLQSSQLDVTAGTTAGGLISSSLSVSGTATMDGLDVTTDSGGSGGVIENSGSMTISGALNADEAVINTLSGCNATVIHRFDLDSDGDYYEIPEDMEYGVPSYNCITGP